MTAVVRPFLTVLLATALCLVSFAAYAQSDGQDEVTLRDGGFLRGTIVSVEPDHEVVILLMGSGERRVVRWRDMDHFDRGKYPAAPEPAVTPDQLDSSGSSFGTQGPVHIELNASNDTGSSSGLLIPQLFVNGRQVSQLAPGTPGNVRLHLETASHDVELFRILDSDDDDDDEIRMRVCGAPCDVKLDGRAGRFRVGGFGVTPSRSFSLSDRTGDVSLRVEPGSRARWNAGLITASLGAAGVTGGATLLILGSMSHAEQGSGLPSASSGTSGMTIGGATTVGVSAAALVTGVVLMVTARTRISFLTPPEDSLSESPLKHAAYALLGKPLLTF